MKRSSEHQLTKDNVQAAESSIEPRHPEGFDKAPPEILAKRRILKARRTGAAHAPVSSSAPNPFASISTAPIAPTNSPAKAETPAENGTSNGPTYPIPNAVQQEQKKKSPDAAEATLSSPPTAKRVKAADGLARAPAPASSSADEAKEKTKAPVVAQSEKPVESEKAGNEADVTSVEKAAAVTKEEVVGDTQETAKAADVPKVVAQDTEKPKEEKAIVNAQATVEATSEGGNIEDGTKEKEEKSAPAPKEKAAAKQTNGDVRRKVVVFGGATATESVSFASAAKSDGGFKFTPSASAEADAEAVLSLRANKSSEFKEAKVVTGEEDEKELFRGRAKLYSLESEKGSARWKERGVGALKLNLHNECGKVRLLMRTEATLRVVLNTPVFQKFHMDRATERSIRFQGFDTDEGNENKRKAFLVRFATRDVASELVSAIEKWKKEDEE